MANLFDNLIKLIRGKGKIPAEGNPKGLSVNVRTRKYKELPIDELPVRNSKKARELIEMRKYSRHVRHCESYAVRDVFGSSDGDDRGWSISEETETGEPIDPQVYEILMALKDRRFQDEYVIGQDKLHTALKEALGYGDSFLSWGAEIGADGKFEINQTMYLPCWQMFRITDNQNVLTHFEQKMPGEREGLVIPAIKVIQFSYERDRLYGQSMHAQSGDNWSDVKNAAMDLADAIRAIGINPNIHTMPAGYTKDQKDSYQEDYEDQLLEGVITDLFLLHGTEVKKLAIQYPNLSPLVRNLEDRKKEMIPPGFPIWLFPEFKVDGAREISGQPALAYMRMRNSWCGMIATGIRQLLDTELIFKLGYEQFIERGSYRIVFPQWKATVLQGLYTDTDESDTVGIDDTEDTSDKDDDDDLLNRYPEVALNGHRI